MIYCVKVYVTKLTKKEHSLLIPGVKDYQDTQFWKIISRAGERAGIKFRVSVHTLRHSYAMYLLKKNVPIRYIRDILGHENLNTTMIYTQISNRDLEVKIEGIDF